MRLFLTVCCWLRVHWKDKTVLEVGAAPGYGYKALRDLGKQIDGWDHNHDLVRLVRAHGLNIQDRDIFDSVGRVAPYDITSSAIFSSIPSWTIRCLIR